MREVDGVPDLAVADLEAVVVGSDLRRTGWFSSSHQLLDRFHDNVVWGMRGNFLDVPTDCPQRDERLGWTGDIQVFAPTASLPVRHAPGSRPPGWRTWPPSRIRTVRSRSSSRRAAQSRLRRGRLG